MNTLLHNAYMLVHWYEIIFSRLEMLGVVLFSWTVIIELGDRRWETVDRNAISIRTSWKYTLEGEISKFYWLSKYL